MMDGYNHTWLVRISLYVFYVKCWNIKRVLKKKKNLLFLNDEFFINVKKDERLA